MIAAVYALAAVGLNLQFGYTGLLNFGQAGFLLVGAYGTAIAVDKWGLPFVARGVRRDRGGGAARPAARASRRCGCAPTTSRSSRSRSAEILRIVVNSTSVQTLTGGPQGIEGFANWFFDINPIPGGRRYGIRLGHVHEPRPVGDPRHVGARRRSASSLGHAARAQPVGSGRSGRSARTRTPRARSARTCSPTRCRAWSSAV